ncbi:MAG: stage 0 sporulation family protein [Desulfobacteraceae bacterium]
METLQERLDLLGRIVGVQIDARGRIQDFDAGEINLCKGDRVLVETENGSAFGVVCTRPRVRCNTLPQRSLSKVLGHATQSDVEKFQKKCELEREVYAYCQDRIQSRSISMCLVAVEKVDDNGKIMVYFTADGRVDFRELVKDLVRRFKTRIEMRQIGVRHEAKMFGGLGTCGRQLCCVSFLSSFSPVSIKMAKEQNLSLNPSKISGMCGRLMCCLAYEFDYYEEAGRNLPKIGKRVTTSQGEGKVIRQNLLKRVLTVQLDSGEEVEVSTDEVAKQRRTRKRTKERGEN